MTSSSADRSLVLYRATVTKLSDAAGPISPLHECFVFFEAPRSLRDGTLESLLHWAWRVDVSTLIITSYSERELLDLWSAGPDADGDVRLFEIAWHSGSVFYADPACVHYFVQSHTQARLQAVLPVVARRRSEGFTLPTSDVERRQSHRQWVEHSAGGAA